MMEITLPIGILVLLQPTLSHECLQQESLLHFPRPKAILSPLTASWTQADEDGKKNAGILVPLMHSAIEIALAREDSLGLVEG